MPSLYITHPGSTLRTRSASLIVTERKGENGQAVLLEVEPHHIDVVGLVGDVHVTADALRRCFDLGIPVAWLSIGGELLGRCVPSMDRNGSLRLAQYAAATDASRVMGIAAQIVRAKAHNAAALLEDVLGNDSGNETVQKGLQALRGSIDAVGQQVDLASLRGVEGAAAAAFFGAFGAALRDATGMTFSRRQRRPPPDPVNALLSFASVLLGNRITGMLESRGLDPAIGFLHELRSGRPSLALDLLEEWRAPVVERFVLRVCNLRSIRPEHFEQSEDEEGVRFSREGLKVFFVEWEKFLDRPIRGSAGPDLALEDALRRQVDLFASAVRTGEPYVPFRTR